MGCILCRLRRRGGSAGAEIRLSSYLVFGLGICAIHADRLVDELIDGASVRDILRDAKAGNW